MASNVKQLPDGGKIVFDWSAFDQIRKSAGIKSQLKDLGDSMASRAGSDHFMCSVFDKSSRAIAVVTSNSYEGAYDEAVNKSLTKAVR